MQMNPGGFRILRVKVWNNTVANLSLLAFGTGAPEILLSCIEIIFNNLGGRTWTKYYSKLAAFNLLKLSLASALCIPDDEVRRVKTEKGDEESQALDRDSDDEDNAEIIEWKKRLSPMVRTSGADGHVSVKWSTKDILSLFLVLTTKAARENLKFDHGETTKTTYYLSMIVRKRDEFQITETMMVELYWEKSPRQ
ncbi:NCX [Mytilus edulis]|uniref:SLC8A n=1 Tax=Mytilus edulis TaxID=6550 RepID=A0A8S3U1P4_MYTED|nr:NCX [Mytilus edulis]